MQKGARLQRFPWNVVDAGDRAAREKEPPRNQVQRDLRRRRAGCKRLAILKVIVEQAVVNVGHGGGRPSPQWLAIRQQGPLEGCLAADLTSVIVRDLRGSGARPKKAAPGLKPHGRWARRRRGGPDATR